MKITTLFLILSVAVPGFFSGADASEKKIDCRRYKKYQQGCPEIYAPVCGTDDKTYDNECVLCIAILSGADIDLAYRGQCVDCSNYPQPPEGSSTDCPNVYAPVCGTDNQTYAHICILCAKIWVSKKKIGIIHEGTCM